MSETARIARMCNMQLSSLIANLSPYMVSEAPKPLVYRAIAFLFYNEGQRRRQLTDERERNGAKSVRQGKSWNWGGGCTGGAGAWRGRWKRHRLLRFAFSGTCNARKWKYGNVGPPSLSTGKISELTSPTFQIMGEWPNGLPRQSLNTRKVLFLAFYHFRTMWWDYPNCIKSLDYYVNYAALYSARITNPIHCNL